MYRRMAIFSRSATAVLFATLCFSGNTVRAQQSAQKGNAQTQAQAKENPFSGAEDKKLMVFAGAWQEDVRYAGDPADSPSGKGRWIARPAYGLYLVIGYEGNGPEGDSHAHGVMAYDHEDRVYKLWWFDDAGGIGEYSGNWKDDNTLVLEHKKTAGGRPFRERITYTHVSDDEVHTRIEQAWGTEAYKVYLDASAQRAQLTEGKGRNRLPRSRTETLATSPQVSVFLSVFSALSVLSVSIFFPLSPASLATQGRNQRKRRERREHRERKAAED